MAAAVRSRTPLLPHPPPSSRTRDRAHGRPPAHDTWSAEQQPHHDQV